MSTVQLHPAILRSAYRRYLLTLLLFAAGGFLWGFAVLVAGLYLPDSSDIYPDIYLWMPAGAAAPYAAMIYGWYCMLHSLYIALALLLAHILASRGWLLAAAWAAMLPGPGLLFSLPQIAIAVAIAIRLKRPLWRDFFSKSFPVWDANRLTSQKSKKLLYHRGSSSAG